MHTWSLSDIFDEVDPRWYPIPPKTHSKSQASNHQHNHNHNHNHYSNMFAHAHYETRAYHTNTRHTRWQSKVKNKNKNKKTKMVVREKKLRNKGMWAPLNAWAQTVAKRNSVLSTQVHAWVRTSSHISGKVITHPIEKNTNREMMKSHPLLWFCSIFKQKKGAAKTAIHRHVIPWK